MEAEDRERLKLNAVLLEADLDVKDLLAYLFQEDVITQNDWDEIVATEPKTPLTRTRALLRILPKCGPKAYSVFRKALDEYNYSFLRQKLDETTVEICNKDEWLNGLSDDVKSRPPTEQELNRLAGRLGMNWEQIGVALGLTSIHIEQLKMQHGTSHIPTLIFKMFSKWRGLKGKAATWEVLLRALIDSDVRESVYQSVLIT